MAIMSIFLIAISWLSVKADVCQQYRDFGTFEDHCEQHDIDEATRDSLGVQTATAQAKAACEGESGCRWHNNHCMLEEDTSCCVDGDVKLTSYPRGMPMFFYEPEKGSPSWKELCAEQFANNHNGARVVCRQLGFHQGKRHRVKRKYTDFAVNVGYCDGGDHKNPEGVLGCTGGGNGTRRTARCKKGKKKGVDILCSERYTDAHDEAPAVIPQYTCDRERIVCGEEGKAKNAGYCFQVARQWQCNAKRHARFCNQSCNRCELMATDR